MAGHRLGTVGMSASEILKWAPHEPDIKNARYVHFRPGSIKNIGTKTHPRITAETVTSIPGEQPRLHKQFIRPRNPNYKGPLYSCPAILIDCDCERFVFKWEYALWKNGAAEIIRGNGAPAVETNPQNIPGCCKHHFIILKTLQKARV